MTWRSNYNSFFFLTLLLWQNNLHLPTLAVLDGMCGPRNEYDSSKQICCDGQAYPKDKFLCCNGTKECPSGSCAEYICCNDQLIKKEKHACCENTIIVLNTIADVTSKDDLICCGKGYISSSNIKTKSCCGGEIIDNDKNTGCCHDKSFDETTHRCRNDRIIRKTENLCVNEVYDMTTSGCCEGELHKNIAELEILRNGLVVPNPSFGCCGRELMDPQNEKCCAKHNFGYHSHKILKDDKIQCCGEGHFNVSHEKCINGFATILGDHQDQCGNYVISKETQGCCENKLPYDYKTQECCSGSNYCVIGKGEECCNGYPVRNDEICCQKLKPCVKDDDDDDKCCFNYITNRGKSYKSNSDLTCRLGKLVRKNVGHPCGPKSYFSPKNEICCQSNVYRRSDGYIACCGNKGYKDGEYCCNGKVEKRKFSKMKKCCAGREVYDKRYSICRKDGRVEFRRPYYSICRSHLFDGSIEQACVRRIGVVGKVVKVEAFHEKGYSLFTMKLKNVGVFQKPTSVSEKKLSSLSIRIQTLDRKKKQCLKYFKKKRKFILFFDKNIKRNQVQIDKNSPFFITKYSRKRYRYLTESLSKSACKPYMT